MASIKKELISRSIIYGHIQIFRNNYFSGCHRNISTLNCPRRIWYSSNSNCNYFFFGIFSDLGIAPAIIQNKDLTGKDLNRIFSFTLWLGIMISILFFLCSWPISFFYKQKTLLTICQLSTH